MISAGSETVRRWLTPMARRPRFPLSVAALAVATCLAVNVPLFYVFVSSLEAGWSGYWHAVASPLTLRLLGRTLGLAVAASAARCGR